MKNNYSPDIITAFNFLGIYQIIGGIIGFVLMLVLLSDLAEIPILLFALLSVAFLLFGYSIWCGILLVKKKTSGLKHSTINQFLQLVTVAFLGYSFKYASGVFFTIGFDITDGFLFTFNLGISSWQMEINSGAPTIAVSLNFVALFLIIYISKLKIKVHSQWMQNQITQIGEPVI